MMIATLLSLALVAPLGESTRPEAIEANITASFADSLAIKAKTVHIGDGRTIENGVVTIRDGKIQRVVASGNVPEGMPVIEHDGALTAGMIALHTYSGGANDVNESTRAFTAECDLIHAFRPSHDDFAEAAAAGITSVVLAPPATNVSGGVTAVVKTAGGKVARKRSHLALSVCGESLISNRYPTSYTSAIADLDERFAKGEGAYGEAKSGKLSVLVDVRTRQDVMRAIGLAKRNGLKGALYGAELAGEVANEIKASGMSVVIAPLDWNTTGRALMALDSLGQAGVPFGFGLDAPQNPVGAMRQTAAMCVRAGMKPADVWKGLTSNAAKIAGVESRIGTIAQGRDADLVLWSGDPLDLGSTVEHVFIDGVKVHGGEK